MSNIAPVLFVNFSDQPFSAVPYNWPIGSEEQTTDEHCKWDGVPDSFAPHSSRYMEEWRAQHFAKHLINRELDKLGKPINDLKLQSEMLKKCVMDKGQEVASSNIDMELMNKNISKSEPSSDITPEIKKRGRPSKKEITAEPEFPDLKE